MTLLKVVEAEVSEIKLSDVEYEVIRAGTAKGRQGTLASATERQRISYHREIEAAMKLGEEMFSDGKTISEEKSSHRPPSATRKPNKKAAYSPKRKQRRFRQPTDPPDW